MLEYEKVKYKNNYYAVICLKHGNVDIPLVIDWQDLKKINDLDKKWKCNRSGFVSCFHTLDGQTKEVFIHEIIMALKQKDENQKQLNKPILHVNKIPLDNRRDNLIYDTFYKDINKNLKKKENC